MKNTHRTAASSIAALVLLLLANLTPPASAQVAGAPAFVDYQGTAYKSTGEPLGSTGAGTQASPYVAAPANYTMRFKIYDAQSAGTLIWAETQTVTASMGQFSVRLGSGAAISGLAPAPTQSSIAAAFNSKERYLELTVIIPPATTGTPIIPRLAFQSSPFSLVAERAKSADSVNGVVTAAAGSTFTGVVTAAAGSTFAGVVTAAAGSSFAGGTFTGGTFTGGTFSGTGAGLSTLNADNITSGTIPAARLPIDVALLTKPTTQTFLGPVALTGESTVASKQVAVGESKLRILQGYVNQNGAVGEGGPSFSGNGFTVSHPATGRYTITFAPVFAALPSVTANVVAPLGTNGEDNYIVITALTSGSCTLEVVDDSADTTRLIQDAGFTFIAIGVR